MTLRTRIRLARLEYAVMRFESAAMIALTILATAAAYLLAGWHVLPESVWIAVSSFGLVAEGVLIWSSMSDPKAGTGHVGGMLEEYFGVLGIDNDSIRKQVDRAIEYRARMEEVLGGKKRALDGAVSETVAGVDNWLRGIGRLAKRLDQIRDEASFLSAEKFRLRKRIDDLDCQVREGSDKKTQRQLRETVAGRKHQLRKIEELENLLERGELRLEHAVGALGTIYAQVTIFAARGTDEGDAARLAGEISNEIEQVDAVLAAMDRVYETSPAGLDDRDGDDTNHGTLALTHREPND